MKLTFIIIFIFFYDAICYMKRTKKTKIIGNNSKLSTDKIKNKIE